MFNLIAEIIELIYRYVWGSYGMAILILTMGINLLLTPLTVKSTKSMLAMTEVQPEIKKLTAQHRQDRVRLNQELSALYREKNINPLGGCLPILVQLPIFFVLYQVLRGLIRRASDIGYAVGRFTGGAASNDSLDQANRSFNPNWLDTEDKMFQDLSSDNEMVSWGLDLALNPWNVVTTDIARSLPYIFVIGVLGVLSFIQQKQIAGRRGGQIAPQQRIIMRIFPLAIVVFSFILPFAMSVYFLGGSIVRVLQQSYLTRKIYRPHAENKTEDAEEVDEVEAADEPKGLLGGFLKQEPEQVQHGSSPLSKAPKPKPPKAKAPPPPPPPPPEPKGKKASKKNTEPETPPPTKASKRVTPKKKPDDGQRRKRR